MSDSEHTAPRITGWGRAETGELLHLDFEAFGEKVSVYRVGDKWKAGKSPRSLEEVAAEEAK